MKDEYFQKIKGLAFSGKDKDPSFKKSDLHRKIDNANGITQ